MQTKGGGGFCDSGQTETTFSKRAKPDILSKNTGKIRQIWPQLQVWRPRLIRERGADARKKEG